MLRIQKKESKQNYCSCSFLSFYLFTFVLFYSVKQRNILSDNNIFLSPLRLIFYNITYSCSLLCLCILFWENTAHCHFSPFYFNNTKWKIFSIFLIIYFETMETFKAMLHYIRINIKNCGPLYYARNEKKGMKWEFIEKLWIFIISVWLRKEKLNFEIDNKFYFLCSCCEYQHIVRWWKIVFHVICEGIFIFVIIANFSLTQLEIFVREYLKYFFFKNNQNFKFFEIFFKKLKYVFLKELEYF